MECSNALHRGSAVASGPKRTTTEKFPTMAICKQAANKLRKKTPFSVRLTYYCVKRKVDRTDPRRGVSEDAADPRRACRYSRWDAARLFLRHHAEAVGQASRQRPGCDTRPDAARLGRLLFAGPVRLRRRLRLRSQHIYRHSLSAAVDRAGVPEDGSSRPARYGDAGRRADVLLHRAVRQHRHADRRRPRRRHDAARRLAAAPRAGARRRFDGHHGRRGARHLDDDELHRERGRA